MYSLLMRLHRSYRSCLAASLPKSYIKSFICRMGENLGNSDSNRRTYRENTIASFRRAASAGASFVEFDVQVTKDGVPVIWHDDRAVWRTPEGCRRDALVSELTLSQFKQLSSSNCACSLSTLPQHSQRISKDTIQSAETSPANSCATHRSQQPQLLRAFHDLDGMPIGDEPCDWACSVDDELPTLAEVFARVPEHVGFDIEVCTLHIFHSYRWTDCMYFSHDIASIGIYSAI